ncbi:hypothetical protein Q8F55_001597 [Vanrija albida]|uniref:Alpha/beta hydrolase fold-3 domain-containing protein n=1 Tax=Vanrija albida TaxID=181172 RepID=A0ABR3QGF9_9TREE
MPAPVVYPLSTFRGAPRVAPNGIPRRLGIALELLAQALVALLTPFNVLIWLIFRPPQTLRVFLLSRIVRDSRWLTPFIIANEGKYSASHKPRRPLIPYGDIEKSVTITNVTAPPAKRQPAAPPVVRPAETYGFILSPNGAKGKGTEKAKPGEKLIIYYHGGAYVIGHPMWTPFPLKIARDTRTRVYSSNYRKTASPGTAWPAQLQDALSAWEYVTRELEFDPVNVILMGESAGGHLSLAVSTQLGEWGDKVPGGLALCSPWTDPTLSHARNPKAWPDYLSTRWGNYTVPSLVRHLTPHGLTSTLVSPGIAPPGSFKHLVDGKTSVFVSVGTTEILGDEIYSFVKVLKNEGIKTSVFEDPNGLHIAPVLTLLAPTPATYTKFAAGVKGLVRDIDAANKERVKEAAAAK